MDNIITPILSLLGAVLLAPHMIPSSIINNLAIMNKRLLLRQIKSYKTNHILEKNASECCISEHLSFRIIPPLFLIIMTYGLLTDTSGRGLSQTVNFSFNISDVLGGAILTTLFISLLLFLYKNQSVRFLRKSDFPVAYFLYYSFVIFICFYMAFQTDNVLGSIFIVIFFSPPAIIIGTLTCFLIPRFIEYGIYKNIKWIFILSNKAITMTILFLKIDEKRILGGLGLFFIVLSLFY